MEMVDTSILDAGIMAQGNTEGNLVKADGFRHRVDELFMQVDKVILLKWE